MARAQYSFFPAEGLPFMGAVVVVALVAWRFEVYWVLPPLAIALVLLVLLFRDPDRTIPAAPLAVVSPVDGKVIDVAPTDKGMLRREAQRLVIRVNSLGAYTARSPIEGKVLSLKENAALGSRLLGVGGLWVRNDAGDDVVLVFQGPRFVGRPAAMVGYGERLGQGQRAAYLRLASFAELYLPLSVKLAVKPGDTVFAGSTVLAELVHE
jgi:phosphatidylserine decarboxylase